MELDTKRMVLEIVKTLVIFGIPLTVVPLLIWAERKISAGMQGRIGPNRVGPFGLLQPLADAVKLIFKEDIVPANADRFLYFLGPLVAYAPPMIIFGVIPVAASLDILGYRIHLQAFDFGLGLVVFMSIVSISVYGVAFGGWASNNKYSLLGGLRSAAQMISYELVLTLSVVAVILETGTVSLRQIQEAQTGGLDRWLILHQPLAALLFFIAMLAENKRLPFDLPEAEPELVGGYHTEYSSMKFAMFFMGEYVAVLGTSALFTTLFLGGWAAPGIVDPRNHQWWNVLLSFGVFSVKVALLVFVIMWIRWTLPRFKYVRLMELSWKGMVPLALANVLVTGYLALPK